MIRRVKGAVHEVLKNHPALAKLLHQKPRSRQWPTVMHAFVKLHPTCAACGSASKLNVHHEKPFHLFPELELVPANLITLCMGVPKCHILLGHGDNFKAWNPQVRTDAATSLEAQTKLAEIVALARADRLMDTGTAKAA